MANFRHTEFKEYFLNTQQIMFGMFFHQPRKCDFQGICFAQTVDRLHCSFFSESGITPCWMFTHTIWSDKYPVLRFAGKHSYCSISYCAVVQSFFQGQRYANEESFFHRSICFAGLFTEIGNFSNKSNRAPALYFVHPHNFTHVFLTDNKITDFLCCLCDFYFCGQWRQWRRC